ncbi:LuxR C-terminal-related transcriptional regulator [Streptomyces sp. NPDC102402]|uniref:LuxR C-terminal-related transcriptional regulator n=1 Tax=Streptomyces sp. NPDC102402 TaxID=3366169 RepID=UPI0037F28FDF
MAGEPAHPGVCTRPAGRRSPIAAPVRVLLVDDRAITRAGIRAVLDRDDAVEVVGEAADAVDAEREALRLRPAVVLADAHSPRLDAARLVSALAARLGDTMPSVLLTAHSTDGAARKALRAGAKGVVLSDATPEQLLFAVHMVAAGYALFAAPGIRNTAGGEGAWPVIAPGAEPDSDRAARDPLTRREREVLQLLARGLSNAEMSAELVVSESTVKSHVQNLLDKLHLRNRVHAVIYAHRAGIAPPVCACSGPPLTGVR